MRDWPRGCASVRGAYWTRTLRFVMWQFADERDMIFNFSHRRIPTLPILRVYTSGVLDAFHPNPPFASHQLVKDSRVQRARWTRGTGRT